MIIFKSTNLTAVFDGVLEDYVVKTARVVTEATNGTRDETYSRAMQEYDVIVGECTIANYRILKDIYMFENSFSINDTRRNIEDATFFIDVDQFKLNSIENKKDNTFLYNGSIPIKKV